MVESVGGLMGFRFEYAAGVLALICATSASAQPLVVIDPGHGGRDPGAVGCNGLQEKVQNVDIGRRIRDLLAGSAQVAMTRDNDVFVELRARATFANDRGARLFVSLHNNANAGAAASGTETWIAVGGSATSRQLATRLQAEMVAEWGLRDRGVKEGNFTVLTATAMPAALTEMAFINRCDPDAGLLNDAGERQNIAAAHARAIAQQLGVNPPVDPPPGGRGTLIGVVFEDVGIGFEDTTRRLDGAQIEVGDERPALANQTALWRLQRAPGSYNVRATQDGFVAATRRCDVIAGAETWCSVGLRRGMDPEPEPEPAPQPEAQPEPAPQPEPDPRPEPEPTPMPEPEGPAPEAPEPEGPSPTPPEPEDPAPEDPAPEGPAPEGPAPEPNPPFGDAGPPTEGAGQSSDGSFCATAPGKSSGDAWLLFGLLALVMRRRRALMSAAVLLSLIGSAQAHVPDVPPEGLTAIVYDGASIALSDLRPIAAGRYIEAIPSPDGARLLLVHAGMGRIDVMHLPDGTPRMLAAGRGVGRRPVWSADGRVVGVRTPDQSATATPLLAYDLQGKAVLPPFRLPAVHARVSDDRVLVTEAGVTYRIDAASERAVRVQACADGAHVVGWDMVQGLWLFRLADAQRVALGAGSHPRCSADGRFVVFERTRDEGAVLTASDLFLVDLSAPTPRPIALTQTADRIELAPHLIGNLLFFVSDGVAWQAHVALPE
ncbi:MAG: N-acetylmuramoyl-L-alanine amidase [Bradymonadia bacterium]|jgi:N-acetylmuramoyl-L-alanine amidase